MEVNTILNMFKAQLQTMLSATTDVSAKSWALMKTKSSILQKIVLGKEMYSSMFLHMLLR
jgi:hypothetical protein